MLKFYRIRNTLNVNEIGKYPQIKDVFHRGLAYGNPEFLGELYFSKIEFEPEVSMPILHRKSKLTDLIEQVPTTPFNLLISDKLKIILESFRKDGIQFFKSSIFQNGIEYCNYFFLNMFVVNNEYIDFQKSTVIWEKKGDDFEKTYVPIFESLHFSSLEEFEKKREEPKDYMESFYIRNLYFRDIKDDFFCLRYIEGGAGFFVSEKLKKEIEDAGCTGIEFQPSELAYNEWIAPGGERERVYGKIR